MDNYKNLVDMIETNSEVKKMVNIYFRGQGRKICFILRTIFEVYGVSVNGTDWLPQSITVRVLTSLFKQLVIMMCLKLW